MVLTIGDVTLDVDSVFAPTCGNAGVWTLTYTATDACGNSASDVQIITILDTTPPSITADADAQVECGEDFDLSGYVASDLCGNVTVEVDSVFDASLWKLRSMDVDLHGNG